MEVASSPTNQPCRSSMDVWTKTSLCSGFSNAPLRSKIDHCKKGRATKRKVWFGPCTVHEYTLGPADDLSIEEFRDLWWSREEFDLIMITARIAANEARHHPIVSGGLDQAFQLAIRTGTQFSQKDQLREHLQQLQVEERGLKLWCQYDRSRRGLEKYTSRQYNIVRRKQREDLNKRVISLSRQGADPKEICMVAERTSRLSVIFARMLAIADHASSRDGIPGSNEMVAAVGKSLERPSVVKTLPGLAAQGFISSRFQ